MKLFLSSLFCCFILLGQVFAQSITTPKAHFGFNVGEDYMLANYEQMDSYFRKLATESDRVVIQPIGVTEEGREHYIMVVSSAENIKRVDEYKAIAQKMARAEGLTEAEARKLADDGKAVVWIDGGMHSNETVGSQQLIETYYQLLSRNDAEMNRILDNVIILICHINPDGQELLANWYMQEKDVTKRNMSIPYLYQKYVGHDNNRDFYMLNMKEASNVSIQQYVEWMPQIIYNHHQTSPAGTIVAGPPYRDPFNHVFDPLLITSLDGVGAAMINRLNQEGKGGYTRLDGAVFSTWWNGGLRTTPYFHNMVGILTETFGNPTPMEVPLVPERLIPNNDTPNPIKPQKWHFKQSIDYSVSMNYAILDYASRNSDQLLYNIYTMGKNAIERGSQDNWTHYPSNIDRITELYEADKQAGKVQATSGRGNSMPSEYFDKVFQDPALRDPRAYILPADQVDFPTAVKFVNALIKSGVLIQQATADFSFKGKTYPAGSYVIKTDQAFRPHVLDMLEPQDHPNDFAYPGGPPVRPYDAAGWTLAMQMGVDYVRVYEQLDGPFERIPYGQVQGFASLKSLDRSSGGYLLDVRVNNSFAVANQLLQAGVQVHRTGTAVGDLPAGSFYIASNGRSALEAASQEYGVHPVAAAKKPTSLTRIEPSRVALFDHYGGSMPSGWVRWLLEQFDFNFQLVYPQDINKGDLNDRFDAILFVGGGLPGVDGTASTIYSRQPSAELVPAQYHHLMGAITNEESIPLLKKFVENGGRIISIGAASSLVNLFGLPVEDALIVGEGNAKKRLTSDDVFVPSSVLRSQVNTDHPATWGLSSEVNLMFSNNPVFKIQKNADNIQPLLWFDQADLLQSGWAWGQQHIQGSTSAVVAKIGKGELYAFGPEITYRAQSHGTFKLLFNQLYKNK